MSYHLDYETFSPLPLGGKAGVGPYKYASHPDAEILCAGVAHNGDGPYWWVNPRHDPLGIYTDPRAARLMAQMAADTEPVYAHFVGFEHAVTKYRWTLDTGLPAIADDRWRCTAAMCRRAALPDGLEQVAELLNLPVKKDGVGKKLIHTFCVLQDDGTRILPAHQPQMWKKMKGYNCTDVSVERLLHGRLSGFELEGALLASFLFDLRLNAQGLPVNVDALKKAKVIIDEANAGITEKFQKLTKLNPTQREKVKALVAQKGLVLEDMKADTIELALQDTVPAEARQILEMYAQLQFAAVAKIKKMLEVVCSDGWVRGSLLWHGAGPGRWSGMGIQPQNFKRPTVKDADLAYRMIRNGCTRADLDLLWGNAVDVMSSCIRNFIQWMGGDLFDADYNAIEARIVCWLAGQEDALQRYFKADNWTGDPKLKPDPYKAMAAIIYSVLEKIVDKDQREVGKRAVLGCGYQMAWEKFQKTCWEQYGIRVSDELAQDAVEAYRSQYHRVKKLWELCDKAARAAIARPGSMFAAGERLRFVVKSINNIPFLLLRLPSGRNIHYPWPRIEWLTVHGKKKQCITFYGEIKNNRWGRVSTYGGKLTENATQGTAFDVMSHGGVNAESKKFKIITLVHDQAPALKLPGQKLSDYVAALVDLPAWSSGLPIKAEGRIIPYYKK